MLHFHKWFYPTPKNILFHLVSIKQEQPLKMERKMSSEAVSYGLTSLCGMVLDITVYGALGHPLTVQYFCGQPTWYSYCEPSHQRKCNACIAAWYCLWGTGTEYIHNVGLIWQIIFKKDSWRCKFQRVECISRGPSRFYSEMECDCKGRGKPLDQLKGCEMEHPCCFF